MVRECVRRYFLEGTAPYLFDQARGEMQWVIFLSLTDGFRIRIKGPVVVTGENRRLKLPPFLARLSEQKTNNCPRTGNLIPFEHFQ